MSSTSERLDQLLHRRGRPDFAAVAGALELLQHELASQGGPMRRRR